MKLTNGIELVPLNGTRFTTPVQVLFNASKVFEGFNIKKEVNFDLLSCLAPLTVESCNFFLPFELLEVPVLNELCG
jgi:hypothetical protein